MLQDFNQMVVLFAFEIDVWLRRMFEGGMDYEGWFAQFDRWNLEMLVFEFEFRFDFRKTMQIQRFYDSFI